MKFKVGDIVQNENYKTIFYLILDADDVNLTYIIVDKSQKFQETVSSIIIDKYYKVVDNNKFIHCFLLQKSKNQLRECWDNHD